MSSGGGGFDTHFDWVREIPHYDQVPVGSPWHDQESPPSLEKMHGAELAVSLDPLPPPPLPEQPAVGPDVFYPLGSSKEEQLANGCDAMEIKPARPFIPDSLKNFFHASIANGSKDWSYSSHPPFSPSIPSLRNSINHTTEPVPCSPPSSQPVTPVLLGSHLHTNSASGGSHNMAKDHDGLLLGAEAIESVSEAHTPFSSMTYSERVEEYHQRYGYLKSFAGLLRILGCFELLLGAAAFACICTYVHKDNEWFNMFGYSTPQLYGGLGGGAAANGQVYYTGPKTAFVLVVAGLAWIVTVAVLVLGMTMYYRTILLDSSWWPLTEFTINLALGVLYLAGAIVYVRDTTRGGLCKHPVFNNGVNGAFCHVEAGQSVAIVLLFITTITYLIGAGVCLKLWRHEAARLRKEGLAQEMTTVGSSIPLSVVGPGSRTSQQTPLPTYQQERMDGQAISPPAPLMTMEPEIVRRPIPAGHIPKPVIIADYLQKYPPIRSAEERERYKAVFNDQYAEYKELHAEVQFMAMRFEEMDQMMHNLPYRPHSQMEKERIEKMVMEYQRKKTDPTFLEKKERCEYLKSKLSHIKKMIQEFNKAAELKDDFLS